MTGSAKSNARILAGECFCRAVGYAVADEFAYAMNCHCSGCRRATGSAFKPFAGIAHDRLSVTRGEDKLTIMAARRTTTCIAGNAARCSIRWCVTAPSSMSPWAHWSTAPQSARRPTSSSAPRRPGLRSQTICRNIRNISATLSARSGEYMLAAAGLCPLREPGRKNSDGDGPNRRGAGPTNEEARVRFTCSPS